MIPIFMAPKVVEIKGGPTVWMCVERLAPFHIPSKTGVEINAPTSDHDYHQGHLSISNYFYIPWKSKTIKKIVPWNC